MRVGVWLGVGVGDRVAVGEGVGRAVAVAEGDTAASAVGGTVGVGVAGFAVGLAVVAGVAFGGIATAVAFGAGEGLGTSARDRGVVTVGAGAVSGAGVAGGGDESIEQDRRRKGRPAVTTRRTGADRARI